MEFLKMIGDMLYMPIEMMGTTGDIGMQVMGGLLGLCYTGVGVLIGGAVWDGVRNPSYTYKEKDPVTGKKTKFEVTPSKKQVMHRINNDFAQAADFESRALYDVSITRTTSYIMMPMKIGNVTTFNRVPSTTEHFKYTNERGFDKIKAPEDKAEMEKMQEYYDRAQESFGKRFLRMFNK